MTVGPHQRVGPGRSSTSFLSCVLDVIDAGGWDVASTLTPAHPWISASPHGRELPAQGWKLHVSAYAWSARAVFDAVLPVVCGREVPFKVVGSARLLEALNSGDAGVAQVGKFVTVYPSDDTEARALGHELASATTGLAGPVVATDRRVVADAPVFYRYGAFGGTMMQTALGEMCSLLIAPDGSLCPDRREPWDATPEWVSDPFGSKRSEGTKPSPIGSQRRGARSWRVRFLIPLSIRACGFPAHGLPMIFLMVTTRIPDSERCRASGRGREPRTTHASRSMPGQL